MTMNNFSPKLTIRSVALSVFCLAYSCLVSAITGPFQYRDQFNSVSYNNSNGSTDWSSSSWDETGDNDNPANGTMQITGNRLRFRPAGAADSIQRTLDLDTATSATLSFSWEYTGDTEDCTGSGSDEVNVLIRANSSDSFTQIGSDICGVPRNRTGTFSESIPVSFLTSTAEIRITAIGFVGGSEFFYVDNVDISGVAPSSNTTSVEIGNTIWYDLDANGVFDGNEAAIADASINLFPNSTCTGPAIQTTSSDSSGNYNFSTTTTGDYCVKVVESSLPAVGYASTTGGFEQSVSALTFGNYFDLDFGFEATTCLPVIDFDTYPDGSATMAGDIITNEFAAWGITVTAAFPNGSPTDPMIFDGANPTGGDPDLGSPHESFGGPGEGDEGAFGEVGENRIPQNRLLIISEDGDTTDPDDNGSGGFLTFEFDRDLSVSELLFLDFGDTLGIVAGQARFYNSSGVQIGGDVILPSVGDNGLGGVNLTQTGVRSVEVQFNQSGSMAKFAICPAIIRESSVGDLVWLDVDADGVYDSGEPGLSNVSVSLYDAGTDGIAGNADDFLIGTTQTGSDGSYLFDDLVASSYYVEVESGTVPSGLGLTPGAVNPLPVFTLAESSSNLAQDFPYTNNSTTDAMVGDLVWVDADNDGVRDPGEPGIAGVTLDLIDANTNAVIASATTGADGQYIFTGVTPGEYIVEVTDTANLLTAYTLTTGPQSNPSPSDPFEVQAGDVLLTLDFGYDNNSLFSITDSVWFDADDDGIFDGSESGISNVTVNLLDADGVVIATAITDINGDFVFPGLENGDYEIQISDANNELIDFDTTTFPAENDGITVTVNNSNVSNESFGYIQRGTIGDTVWNDANSNGVQDPNEIGIENVELTLYFDENGDGVFNGLDTIVGMTTTDALGNYVFEDLIGTDYVVFIDSAQAALTGYTQTADPDEAGVCVTCDAQSGTTLSLGGSDMDQDFGFNNGSLSDISGNVFEDIDSDGVDDGAGEPGFEIVTLELSTAGLDGVFGTADDIVVATTSTDSAGDYIFPSLPDDDYRVQVTDDNNILNDFTITSGLDTVEVNLAGLDITDLDFGYVDDPMTASIGDTVWLDSDGDGVLDPSEAGLPFVELELFEDTNGNGLFDVGDTSIGTTTTDENGNYRFDSLNSGNYFVDVDETTIPSNLTATTYVSGSTTQISLSEGEFFDFADFGFKPDTGTGTLGGLVWSDVDSDGISDIGEVGLPIVTITVIDTDNPANTYTVDSNPDGSWLVTGLPPSNYMVIYDEADIPVAYPESDQPTNLSTGLDSYQLSLVADQSINNLDFGFDPTGAVGGLTGTIYNDLNKDDDQDLDEAGISNVTLNLIECGAGTCNDGDESIVSSTFTDVNGDYSFVGIPPGNYQVQVSDINGTLDNLNQTELLPVTSTVVAGATTTDVDAGYASGNALGSIGNLVFLDVNDDNAYQVGEPGIAGVTMECWFDANDNGVIEPGTDNLIRTVETDENGEYYCSSVPSGSYIVRVTDTNTRLTGYTSTGIVNPLGDDNFSNTTPYALETVTNNYTADFGFKGNLTISGTVFEDSDNNGIDDDGINVSGATIYLFNDLDGDGVLDPGEPQVASTTTNGSGNYSFTSVPAGDYIIVPDSKGTSVDGYTQTTQTGTNGVIAVTVGPNSTDNDFGFYNNGISTTPVTLSSFKATVNESGTEFAWSTETETGNIGFIVYEEVAKGELVALTEMILSKVVDSLEPQNYAVVTDNTRLNQVWISDFDRFGKETKHGPFEVNRQYGTLSEKVEKINWKAIRSEHESKRKLRNSSKSSVSAMNFKVDKDGVYRVSYEDLQSAGMDLSGVNKLDLSFSSQGEAKPLYVNAPNGFGPGSWIEFLGEQVDGSLYTKTNIYTLEINSDNSNGLVEITDNHTAYDELDMSSYHLKQDYRDENKDYTFAAQGEDPWFRDQILAYGGNAQAVYDFNIENRSFGSVELKFDIWGGTDFAGVDDHHVQLKVNGELLNELVFDGLEVFNSSITIPQAMLLDGENTLEVVNVLDTGVLYSLIYTNWVGIEFNQSITIENDYLRFKGLTDLIWQNDLESSINPVKGLQVTNLTTEEVIVYALNRNSVERLTQLDVISGFNGFDVSFADVSNTHEYVVTTESALMLPVIEPVVENHDLLTGSYNYLMITHPDFAESLEPLKNHHENNGLTVKVVDVFSIYNEYSYGLVNPDAIADYIQDVAEQTNVEYVLLAGGDTYDYLNNTGLGSLSFIPTFYVKTENLITYTPSDVPYVDFDGDNVQDVALGRYPARSAFELDNMVTKTLQYATNNYGGTSVFSADRSGKDGDFAEYSEELIAEMSGSWDIQTSYLDDFSPTDARQRIVDKINTGVSLVSYFGHSGYTTWSFDPLMKMTDIESLTNNNLSTVVIQWGCWNAYHVSANARTMAHKFLASDTGAASVLGATTLTSVESDRALGQLFMNQSTLTNMTVGQALVNAKKELATKHPEYLDVLLGYIVLGDPALQLR